MVFEARELFQPIRQEAAHTVRSEHHHTYSIGSDVANS